MLIFKKLFFGNAERELGSYACYDESSLDDNFVSMHSRNSEYKGFGMC